LSLPILDGSGVLTMPGLTSVHNFGSFENICRKIQVAKWGMLTKNGQLTKKWLIEHFKTLFVGKRKVKLFLK
jgi:hypothetical protein